jgi:hypothetical protein
MPAGNVKHGKFIVELKPIYSAYKQIQRPQFGAFGGKDMDNASFSLGWSYLPEPFVMVAEPHTHDFDQYLFIVGGDPTNVYESFDAELEIGLEGVLTSIQYPACIHIPKGTVHGPYNIKRVTKPIMFFDITISAMPSIRPLPAASKRD